MIIKGYDIDLNKATFSLSQRGVIYVGPWLVRGIRPALAAAKRAAMPHEVMGVNEHGRAFKSMTAGSPVDITAQDDGRGHRLIGVWPRVATVGVDGRAAFVGHGSGLGQTTVPSASPETIGKAGPFVVALGAVAIVWMMVKGATAKKNPRRIQRNAGVFSGDPADIKVARDERGDWAVYTRTSSDDPWVVYQGVGKDKKAAQQVRDQILRRHTRRNGGPWDRGPETAPFDALVLPGKTRDWAKKHWDTYGFDYDASAGEVIVWPLSSMRQLKASLEARGVPFRTRQATWKA